MLVSTYRYHRIVHVPAYGRTGGEVYTVRSYTKALQHVAGTWPSLLCVWARSPGRANLGCHIYTHSSLQFRSNSQLGQYPKRSRHLLLGLHSPASPDPKSWPVVESNKGHRSQCEKATRWCESMCRFFLFLESKIYRLLGIVLR